jgi:hypothetical protein
MRYKSIWGAAGGYKDVEYSSISDSSSKMGFDGRMPFRYVKLASFTFE